MLRAVSRFYGEGQALEALARRDAFKLFRSAVHTAQAAHSSQHTNTAAGQTVLTTAPSPEAAAAPAPPPQQHAPPPPPPPPPPPTRSWLGVATAVALTSSIGGVYYYRKINDDATKKVPAKSAAKKAGTEEEEGPIYPATGSELPQRVEFLVVGGGTAAFAALRALRAARPDATLLLAGAERAPPYMRPPLSKELWRRADLAAAARDPLGLAFTQYNGKQRKLIYEPLSFYTPMEKLCAGEAGAGLARGWRVTRLDVAQRAAELTAPGQDPVTVTFDKCLIATGSVAKRLPALAPAAAAGRALALHSVRDVARLAAALQEPRCRRVCVVGAGLLAAELAASLAERFRDDGISVVQVYREAAPLEELLPGYLAADAARRLQEIGVTLLPDSEIESSYVEDNRVHMKLRRTADAGGAGPGSGPGSGLGSGPGSGPAAETLTADVVVECVGAEPAVELAEQAGLELHPELGGIVVNAELQARSGVWAAGDAACFHDVTLGRRRVTHHDHAVLSGRRAAQNMAAQAPTDAEVYSHQSMFWSDLGPQRGYEAIGIIDSRLPTVGVFSADAVSDARPADLVAGEAGAGAASGPGAGAGAAPGAGAGAASAEPDVSTLHTDKAGANKTSESHLAASASAAERQRYERGVVFYLRERRVVGVLLWNLYNRMPVARQVLAQGEFEDLVEVAKLFAPHEED